MAAWRMTLQCRTCSVCSCLRSSSTSSGVTVLPLALDILSVLASEAWAAAYKVWRCAGARLRIR